MKKQLQILSVIFCAGFATSARAGTITVTGTLAQAAAINCYAENPVMATCSESPAYGAANAVADAPAGHLGALLAANAPGYVNGFAQILLGLALNDMTNDDFLEVDMSVHGTFSNGGAVASLYVDTGDSFSATQISCGSGIQQSYGTPCTPGSGVQQVIIPLANVDNLGLTFLLQPTLTYAPAFTDFLHSMDFTITAPSGTNIVNNPGGTLFQTPGPTGVPEPNPGLLVGSGLILALLLGKGHVRRRLPGPARGKAKPWPKPIPA